MLVVEAEFYSHHYAYQFELTTEQRAEFKKNLAYQNKQPYSAADVVNADDNIISLFNLSLRKEIINGLLANL